MSINFTDFSRNNLYQPEEAQPSMALANALNRYKLMNAPQNMRQEQRKQELANTFAEMQNKYYEPQVLSKIQYNQAKAEKAIRGQQNPASSMQGHARNIADLNELMNNPNIPQQYKNLAVKLFQADIDRNQSLVDTRQQNIKYKPVSHLSKDDLADVFSKYRGLGINPQDALELYTAEITPELIEAYKQSAPTASNYEAVQGISQQMGKKFRNGSSLIPVDTRKVKSEPAPTSANRGNYRDLQANIAESSYLGNWVTEHNAPYSQYPRAKDAWVSLTKRNDPAAMRERHEFLAAQMMGPETALLNIKLAQGSNAAQAIADVEDRLKLNAKKLDITMTPEDYKAATRIMHEVLEKGAKLRGNALLGTFQPNQEDEEESKHANAFIDSLNNTQKTIIGVTPDGRRVTVPKNKFAEFEKRGGRRG
jgi:hypothetical protein